MDEFGECTAETLQRQHDEQKAKEMEALESMYPDDFITLTQWGGQGWEEERRRVSRRSRSCLRSRPTRRSTTSGACWLEMAFPPQ